MSSSKTYILLWVRRKAIIGEIEKLGKKADKKELIKTINELGSKLNVQISEAVKIIEELEQHKLCKTYKKLNSSTKLEI